MTSPTHGQWWDLTFSDNQVSHVQASILPGHSEKMQPVVFDMKCPIGTYFHSHFGHHVGHLLWLPRKPRVSIPYLKYCLNNGSMWCSQLMSIWKWHIDQLFGKWLKILATVCLRHDSQISIHAARWKDCDLNKEIQPLHCFHMAWKGDCMVLQVCALCRFSSHSQNNYWEPHDR